MSCETNFGVLKCCKAKLLWEVYLEGNSAFGSPDTFRLTTPQCRACVDVAKQSVWRATRLYSDIDLSLDIIHMQRLKWSAVCGKLGLLWSYVSCVTHLGLISVTAICLGNERGQNFMPLHKQFLVLLVFVARPTGILGAERTSLGATSRLRPRSWKQRGFVSHCSHRRRRRRCHHRCRSQTWMQTLKSTFAGLRSLSIFEA